MAVKKYHVSANLFDKDSMIKSWYISTNGEIIRSADGSYSIIVPCQSNKMYCCIYPTEPTTHLVRWGSIDHYPVIGDIVKNYSATGYGGTSSTYMTSSNAQYLMIFLYNTAAHPDMSPDDFFNRVMLNEGSTPLPYEPYSSEVWHDITPKIYNTSTDTLTILPADIIPDGQPINGITIKGNMSQSGTPSQSSPIYPSETGDKTANLLDKNNIIENYWLSSLNGNAVPQTGYFVSDYIKVSAEEIYNLVDIGRTFCWYDENKTFIRTDTSVTQMSAPVNAKFLRANGSLRLLNSAMIYTGTTALPFEPFGVKIPISSANTTTNVYLGEVQTTRQIKKLVLDGTENVSYNARNDTRERWVVTIPTANGTTIPENVICTHFKTVNSTTKPLSEGGICMRSTGNDVVVGGIYTDIGITAPSDSTTIVNAVKAYLAQQYAAGTPVCVWYVLATEETAVVNEPIRKIGDYADEVSGITIPTISGKDSFDVNTTLKPSEVSLTYHGWHDASAKEWNGSEWD